MDGDSLVCEAARPDNVFIETPWHVTSILKSNAGHVECLGARGEENVLASVIAVQLVGVVGTDLDSGVACHSAGKKPLRHNALELGREVADPNNKLRLLLEIGAGGHGFGTIVVRTLPELDLARLDMGIVFVLTSSKGGIAVVELDVVGGAGYIWPPLIFCSNDRHGDG